MLSSGGVTSADALVVSMLAFSLGGGGAQSLVQNLVHDEFRRQITEVYDMK